jgi:hypothetical protein
MRSISALSMDSKECSKTAAVVIQRRNAVLSATAMAFIFSQHQLRQRINGARGPRLLRMPFEFERHASSLTDRLFRRMYRMPRNVFYKLLDKLKEQDERNTLPALAAKLSMCLRWLAGGSYLDIAVCHRVAVSSFFASSDEVLHLINDSISIEFSPDDRDNNDSQSRAFGRGVSPLSGCVGAIDGLAVRVTEPRAGEIPNPSSYYNRKGFFAIVVQAMCDASYRF